MKKFKVGCNQTEHFSIFISADTEKEAVQKAFKILEDEGMPKEADVFEREFMSVCAEEVTIN